MGNESSKYLDKIVDELSKDQTIDANVLQELFTKFDTNKSGYLEGNEIDNFLDSLFDYVFDKNHPKETNVVSSYGPTYGYGGYAGHAGRGGGYGPTTTVVTHKQHASSAEKIQFKTEIRPLIDSDKDGRINWNEFYNGIIITLKEKVIHLKQ